MRDGEEVANEIEESEYDLAIIDVMLPKISGFELIGYILQYNEPMIF